MANQEPDTALVFDACALIALMHAEAGASVVSALLAGQAACLMHVVNVVEVHYDARRRRDTRSLAQLIEDIEAAGIRVDWRMDVVLLDRVSALKAHHRRVSLADCFALALAESELGPVVTSDHHEFDALAAAGVSVRFIR